MGFFATLHAPLRCPFCDEGTLDRAQFHVGELGDLPDYKLGQRVAGEKRSCIAVGYPEACSACSKDALVSIVIDAGTLRSVHFRSSFPWDPDTVLIGPERIGDDGLLRHGVSSHVTPSKPGRDLPRLLTRQEQALLEEPLTAHLLEAWSEGHVALHATRDAHGRCITEWTLTRETNSLPGPLAARLQSAPLLSAHLGDERASLRITSLPDATRALATLQQSHPTLALVHSIALGILASKDWRLVSPA